MEQGTLFPEPPREQQLSSKERTAIQLELGLDVPEKTPEDMFLEDAVAFLDLQAQVAEARGAKKLAQKLFKTRQQLGNRERNSL